MTGRQSPGIDLGRCRGAKAPGREPKGGAILRRLGGIPRHPEAVFG
jgi:hypothetical protein